MTLTIYALLVKAALYTVLISAVSIVIGITIGMAVAAARLSPNPWLNWTGPRLCQLLPRRAAARAIAADLQSAACARPQRAERRRRRLGLSLCTAAYQAENLRGGFASVPRGLIESAEMVGLTPWQLLVRIRAPIAFRLTLPAIVNEAIIILKASSLVSVVGVIELTRMAQDLDTSMFKPLQLYAAAGVLYFIINRGVAGFGSWVEKRMDWGRA